MPGAGAAVALLEEEAEDVGLAEELDDVPGELVRLVDLGGAGRDALARQRAHEAAQLALLPGQEVEAHAAGSASHMTRSYAARHGVQLSLVFRA